MNTDHSYRAHCLWRGSTGTGYGEYRREHAANAPPAADALTLSADEAFLGRPEHLNPEQLIVLAASSCQLLSFLAVAARARIDVLSYEDDAEAVMPEDQRPVRLTRIALRPRIVVASGPSEDRVRRLVQLAHEQCYVANSLHTQIDIEPQITIAHQITIAPNRHDLLDAD